MDKKPTGPVRPTRPPVEEKGNVKHRFSGDEKTTIMPLSEILRARDENEESELTPVRQQSSLTDELDFLKNPKGGKAAPKGGSDATVVQTKSGFARAKGTERQEPPQARAPQPEARRPEPTPAPAPAPAKPAAPRPQTSTTGEVRKKKSGDNGVVVFFSCKGGSGATALAANVAHYYARDQYKTCLVDLDLQLGDCLAALALQAKTTTAQCIGMLKRGESVTAKDLPQHASGVSVVSQVGAIDDLDKINAEGMAALVEGLRTSFDMVVVDGVRDFSDNVLAVLDVADRIAIVTVQEVLAIRRARWAFTILRKIGFDPRDITVVVNRFDPELEIPFATLKRVFEPGKVLAVPAEARLVLQSLNRGVPLLELNPTHTLTRNIGRMASTLAGDVEAESSEATVVRAKKSFWQGLRFWSKS